VIYDLYLTPVVHISQLEVTREENLYEPDAIRGNSNALYFQFPN
jgi:hypothetical protein